METTHLEHLEGEEEGCDREQVDREGDGKGKGGGGWEAEEGCEGNQHNDHI